MPASPFREERKREPFPIPAGIFNLIRLECSTRPSPPHLWHGFSIICPAPRQRGQVCDTWKKPRELITCPRPAQVGQLIERGPGSAPLPLHWSHVSSLRISISFSVPKAASSSVICISYRKSEPRCRSSARPLPAPPKKLSKIPPLPPPKTSRKISNGSWNPPPKPGAPCEKAACPYRSYAARLSTSIRTS